MTEEAHQEERLRLSDDVAGHTNHHVVELPVLEMILEPGASRPRNHTVDHVELAMIDAADIVSPPVERALARIQAGRGARQQLVDDYLRARARKSREHRRGRAEHATPLRVDEHAHLHALLELLDQEIRELGPDLPLAPAEHQDMDR